MSLATFTYKYWEPVVSVLNMSSCTLSKYSKRATFKDFLTFYVIFNYVYMWGKGASHRRPKKSSDAWSWCSGQLWATWGGCWGPSWGPRREESVPLAAEPSLQLQYSSSLAANKQCCSVYLRVSSTHSVLLCTSGVSGTCGCRHIVGLRSNLKRL